MSSKGKIMTRKFRFLPLSIVVMSLILGVKIVDFSVGVEEVFAEAREPEGNQKPVEHEAEETATEEVPALQLSSIPTRKEIEYLQKLVDRRQELDRRSRELDDREKLLEAVELRIVERTESLKKIKETIEAALAKHAKREKVQLDSLVKIYSAMKPKEAAQIFNFLDDDVLIAIVENMNEKKMGAILAKMSLDKAKKLTVSLATRERLPKIEG